MSQTETDLPPTSNERTFDIRATIDTDSLPRSQSPSGGHADPASIGQDQGHLIVTAGREIEGQGTGALVFEASAGDTLRFFISSGSNNFEQVVWIEGIHHAGGDEILRDFTIGTVERETIAPESPSNVFPAQIIKRKFRFGQGVVTGEGTGSYDLAFALYDRGEESQTHSVSHYRWALQLTAQLRRRES